jgi:hypothetical protein
VSRDSFSYFFREERNAFFFDPTKKNIMSTTTTTTTSTKIMARNNPLLFFFFFFFCACFRCRATTTTAFSSSSSSSLESSQGRHYYPPKFDAEEMLLLNQKRVAVETSQIYDDLTGESGSFFENYYREEKEEEEERDLSANAIVEKALEGARVSRESEEGVAIENAIQRVIKDAEMQLQNFLEASSSTTIKTTAKTNGPDGNTRVWNYEGHYGGGGGGDNEEDVLATPLINGNEDGGGFFQEFFLGSGGGQLPARQPIFDAPRYDDTTLATQPFGTNLPLDNIPPRPNVDPNYVTYTAQGLMGNFLQALTWIVAVPFANNPTFFDDWQRCSTLIRPCTIRETLSRCTYEPRNSWYRERRSRINAPVGWPYCQPDLEEVYEYCNEIELQSSICDPKLARERRDIAIFETNAALEQERLRAMYENGDAGSGPFWYGPYQGGYYGPSQYGPYNVGPNGNGGYPSAAYPTTGNNNNNVPTGMPTNNNRGRGGGGYFEEEYYYEAGFGYPYQDPYYPFPYLDQQPNYYHGARLGR